MALLRPFVALSVVTGLADAQVNPPSNQPSNQNGSPQVNPPSQPAGTSGSGSGSGWMGLVPTDPGGSTGPDCDRPQHYNNCPDSCCSGGFCPPDCVPLIACCPSDLGAGCHLGGMTVLSLVQQHNCTESCCTGGSCPPDCVQLIPCCPSGNSTSPDCNNMPAHCTQSCCSGGSCPPDCAPWIPCCNSGNDPACGGCTNVPCTNMCGAMPCQFCDGHGHCTSTPQPCGPTGPPPISYMCDPSDDSPCKFMELVEAMDEGKPYNHIRNLFCPCRRVLHAHHGEDANLQSSCGGSA